MLSLVKRGQILASRTRYVVNKLNSRKMGFYADLFKEPYAPGPSVYRNEGFVPNKSAEMVATGLMAFAWYWILYHIYYDFETFAGHGALPDPAKWTDAELGIPPEDSD